jgi:hypothetical protein
MPIRVKFDRENQIAGGAKTFALAPGKRFDINADAVAFAERIWTVRVIICINKCLFYGNCFESVVSILAGNYARLRVLTIAAKRT